MVAPLFRNIWSPPYSRVKDLFLRAYCQELQELIPRRGLDWILLVLSKHRRLAVLYSARLMLVCGAPGFVSSQSQFPLFAGRRSTSFSKPMLLCTLYFFLHSHFFVFGSRKILFFRGGIKTLNRSETVSYTHLTLPTILLV